MKTQRRQPLPPRRAGRHARLQVAAEAARILAEKGAGDFGMAKKKAAARLAIDSKTGLPTNEEVEQALKDHLQIFQSKTLAERVAKHRRIAVKAMEFLEVFSPRAVGNIVTGIIPPHSAVQLHVRADDPEQVALTLIHNDIPFDQSSRRLRFGGDRYQNTPICRFTADSVAIELFVFSPADFREPPLSPIDGKPTRRLTLKEMNKLATQNHA